MFASNFETFEIQQGKFKFFILPCFFILNFLKKKQKQKF